MRTRWTTILLLSWAICPVACSNDSDGGDASETGGEGGGASETGGEGGNANEAGGEGGSANETGGEGGNANEAGGEGGGEGDENCASGCSIEGVCYPEGSSPDDNPCVHCDPSASSSEWTDNDGASCSDGLFCTVDDVCSAGTCGGAAKDCSDGVECTGEETCDEDGDRCVAGTPTCGDFTLCEVVTDTCVSTCTNGCVIDSVCYGDGQTNPLNPCQKCDASAGDTAWSDNDGAACDDGVFCNGDDTCSAGACEVHDGDPCADDGYYCNGTESCSETAGACVSSGDPCTETGQDCSEDEDSCCTPGVPVADPTCNTDGDVVQHDDCGGEILVEDCLDASANGGCQNATCGCAAGFAGDTCDECRFFVSTDGDDANLGSSWLSALATVQAGLDAAAAKVESGEFTACEVWVAGGTYVPTSGSGRGKTISLKPHVALYGGFAGTEFVLSERHIAAATTILSGDFDQDGDTSDNAYHVVTGADSATIDGFTITAGNADGSAPHNRGGGMYSYDSSSLAVTNCTFSGNSAKEGGGMYNYASSPTVSGCTFSGNAADDLGGGMCNSFSSPTVTNCTFSGNSADVGGGMSNYAYSPSVTNCAFLGNSAKEGGGMYNNYSKPTVTNCTFSGNSADVGGGMSTDSSSPTISNCTFSGNSANDGGGMYNNNNSSSLAVTNCTFSGNSADNGGGMRNNSSSPVVSNSVFWGDTATSSGPEIYNDSSSSPAVTYSIVEGGYAGNLDADPLFVSATVLQLQATSPAIDAADGCAAPLTDIEGNGRVDIANLANTGVGPAADIGAHEYQGGSEDGTADPSLAVCCMVDTDTTLAHDYYYCPTSGTWADAEAYCQAAGMHLASIGDAEENAVVETLVAGNAYIGANDIDLEGTWTWSSGDDWDSSTANWASSEPNNDGTGEDCGVISSASGKWNDVACTKLFPFVCETTD